MSEHIGEAAIKLSPPVAVTGTLVAGISLNEWVCIVTIIYTVLQIALLVHKTLRKAKSRGRE